MFDVALPNQVLTWLFPKQHGWRVNLPTATARIAHEGIVVAVVVVVVIVVVVVVVVVVSGSVTFFWRLKPQAHAFPGSRRTGVSNKQPFWKTTNVDSRPDGCRRIKLMREKKTWRIPLTLKGCQGCP